MESKSSKNDGGSSNGSNISHSFYFHRYMEGKDKGELANPLSINDLAKSVCEIMGVGKLSDLDEFEGVENIASLHEDERLSLRWDLLYYLNLGNKIAQN